MATEKTHIIYQGPLARLPQHCYGTRVDTARKYSNAADDILPACRRKKHGLRRAYSLIPRRLIQQVNLCKRRMQSDEHRVRLEPDSVAHHVMSTGQVKYAM